MTYPTTPVGYNKIMMGGPTEQYDANGNLVGFSAQVPTTGNVPVATYSNDANGNVTGFVGISQSNVYLPNGLGHVVYDATVTTGTNAFSSATAVFKASDVGSLFTYYSGNSGTVVGYGTIASVTAGTGNAVLSITSSSGGTQTNCVFVWGPDQTTQAQSALATAYTLGSTATMGDGITCIGAAGLTIPDGVTLLGPGRLDGFYLPQNIKYYKACFVLCAAYSGSYGGLTLGDQTRLSDAKIYGVNFDAMLNANIACYQRTTSTVYDCMIARGKDNVGSGCVLRMAAGSLIFNSSIVAHNQGHGLVADTVADLIISNNYIFGAGGSSTAVGASFTGTVSTNTTLTVSGVTGTLAIGQVVYYPAGTAIGIVMAGSGASWTISSTSNIGPVSMTTGGAIHNVIGATYNVRHNVKISSCIDVALSNNHMWKSADIACFGSCLHLESYSSTSVKNVRVGNNFFDTSYGPQISIQVYDTFTMQSVSIYGNSAGQGDAVAGGLYPWCQIMGANTGSGFLKSISFAGNVGDSSFQTQSNGTYTAFIQGFSVPNLRSVTCQGNAINNCAVGYANFTPNNSVASNVCLPYGSSVTTSF